MKFNVTKFTKVILDIMFVSGILIVLTLPLILKVFGKYVDSQLLEYLWCMTFVYGICGICSLMIVWELRKMFQTVLREDCFVRSNVKSLEKMGTYSFVIAVLMVVRCFIYITLASVAIIVVFVIAGLFSKVLAQVFDKAVTYKLENDLTI